MISLQDSDLLLLESLKNRKRTTELNINKAECMQNKLRISKGKQLYEKYWANVVWIWHQKEN